MTTNEVTTAKVFLTDYASYNNGSQFEFGHWVNLSDFSDASEFLEYVSNHFQECDSKSPLDSPREEMMITDYEGFPAFLYSESMSESDLEKIYKYIELDFENLSDGELVSLWNEYCSETSHSDDEIFSFDEEFFEVFFANKPMEATRAASFGSINWSDDYIRFNGYGNLESFDDPKDYIDEKELLEYLLDK